MQEAVDRGYIRKKEKGSGEYENLYMEGIELLQRLSGTQWTDFNEHDPGVTILENLAYTLTNLSYKTKFPIQDILVESKGSKLESGDNGFFVPSDILTTNPITILDLRKLFIDQITNVKNVWIAPQVISQENTQNHINQNNIKGLYHVYVEMYNYEEDPVALKKEEDRIKREIIELYHQHRNLCEDLYDVTIFKPFELQVKLKLTISEEVSGEEVFANIYYYINDHLTHEVRFYSLWELQDRKEDINTIFDGPLLENGFINDSELKERLGYIVPQDIVKLIAKVEGVISVDFFELSYKDINQGGDGWKVIADDRIAVPENYSPTLLFPTTSSGLTLENGGVKFSPDLTEVQKQLSYIQAMNYGSFKSVSKSLNSVDIPEGNNLRLGEYYPIREQFPLAYGIGEFGLPTGLPDARYAQANQLKAYLLPFDQLMNNFLAQLTHIYDLYDAKGKAIQSYFYDELADMPELVQLIKTYEGESPEESLRHWETTLKTLNSNYDHLALERLNEVADNLLARYAEEFPTYSLKKIHINSYGKNLASQQFEDNLLTSKRTLIANYDKLSYNRAKAYDYTQTVKVKDDFGVENIGNDITPGIIQKTAILMGIKNFETRSLAKVIADSGVKIYQKKEGLEIISEKLEIVYSKEDIQVVTVDDIIIIDETVENLRDSFYYLGYSGHILEDVLRNGVLPENYQIKQTTNDKKNSYYVLFNKEGKQSSVVHVADSEDQAKAAIDYSVQFLVDLNEKSEGLYLIEHLLLAPPYHGEYFGFSFSLPVEGSDSVTFNQLKLLSNSNRNDDVNEIMMNLTPNGSIDFKSITVNEKQVIQILNGAGEQIAVSESNYEHKEDAAQIIDKIKVALVGLEPNHYANEVLYYAYYGNERVDETFFSFQMSVVLPSWPVRFQDQNFRNKFDNIIYEQAPIHIAFQSYWIDLMEMAAFEKSFYKWLGLVSNNDHVEEQMKHAHELILKIQQYHQQAGK